MRPLGTSDALDASISAIAFHRDGNLVATGDSRGRLTLWDVGDRAFPEAEATLRGQSSAMTDLSLSPNGRLVVTTYGDGTAILWSVGDLPEVVANARSLACGSAGAGVTAEWWERYVPGIPYRDPCP